MGQIFRPHNRLLAPGQQPQYPVKINRRQLLGRHVKHAFIGGHGRLDYGTQELLTPNSDFAQHGPGYVHLETSNPNFFTSPNVVKPVEQLTIIARFRAEAITTNMGIFADKNVTNWSSENGVSFVIRSDGGLLGKVGTSEATQTAITLVANVWYTVAYVWKAGIGAWLYVDGLQPSSYVTQAAAASMTASTEDLAVGAYYDRGTTRCFDGDLEFVFMLDQALEDGDIQEFSSNPYQLFKPAVPMPVFFPTSASALNNLRISYMHFQRHYEPIAMGE